jgi:glycosyltransferase involved in cell wall biosynthesis
LDSPTERDVHVVYDHQIFSTQEYGGISRYCVEVARELEHLADTRVTILAPLHINGFLRAQPPSHVVGTHVRPLRHTARVRAIVNDGVSRRWLSVHRPSILHETYYREHSLAPVGSRTVVTVYDMIHERFARTFPASDQTASLKAAAVRRADAVICISEHTRRDLLELLPVEPEKVSVVHLAPTFGIAPSNLRTLEIRDPYLLYVGHRRAYKNFAALLRAIASSDSLRRGFRLVCFGGGQFTAEEWSMAQALGFDSTSLLQREGDDTRLASFYAHAAAFVYPSLYEGFGIPILEAMAHRCPVACSATSSLPEVGGDAVEYFDPTRPEDIATAIHRIVDSELRAHDLRRRGAARVGLFSWLQCARDTHRVYERLL